MRQPNRLKIWALAATLVIGAMLDSARAQSQSAATAEKSGDSRTVPIQKMELTGLPNFGEVTPTLYRGGNPSPEGLRKLREMGIAIVVDLRGENRREQNLVEKLGMRYTAIGGHCFDPTNAQYAGFLAVVDNNPGKEIFVHCRLGDDRTGMAVAAFRMADQGWSPEAAMEEMRAYGFNSFHHVICPFLARYEEDFPRTYASAPDFAAARRVHPPREPQAAATSQ